MKSALYLGKKSINIVDTEIPIPGDNDVVIKNIYSSICGTDAAVYMHGPNTGHKVAVGGEFGHETVSRITATGKNVTDFKVGQRVYPYPLFAKNDINRAGTLGAFSEYILIPEAKLNHSLYTVPSCISDKTACLIEPFTVGFRAAKRSQPVSGEKAIVFGCGTIGLASAIGLKCSGIKKVMLCDVSDFRLSIAEKMGFAVCSIKDLDWHKKTEQYFGTAPSLSVKEADIDIVIDAAGQNTILDFYMKHGKIGSRFVSVAVGQAVRNIDLLHMTYAQQSIIGSGGYVPEDVRDVMDMMVSGTYNIESIITQEFSIENLDKAIRTAADPEHAFNVIIDFAKS